MIGEFLLIFLTFVSLLVVIYILFPFFFGAPYEKTKDNKINSVEKLLDLKKEDFFVDLGSGKGDLVLNLAKFNCNIFCYEINPILVFISKIKIRKSGFRNIFVFWRSFWRVDLSKFNKIYVFQFPHVMGGLERKILRECKKGTVVVSNHWKFKNLKPKKIVDDLYFYVLE